MDFSVLIYVYDLVFGNVDGVILVIFKYFVQKGLFWIYWGGKWVDFVMLYFWEWLGVICNGMLVSCGIDEGFEEVMFVYMVGLFWKFGCRVEWDGMVE